MSFDRRTVIKGAAAQPQHSPYQPSWTRAVRQEDQHLTWNIPDQADLINGWIKAFQEKHAGVEVEWLDKKGPELPTFYQTSLWPARRPTSSTRKGRSGSNTPPTARCRT
jgi:hypothetical protein